MGFNFATILEDVVSIGPAIYAAVMGLKSESSTATKVQLATDSLNVATGISQALLSTDPVTAQKAQVASNVAASIIQGIHAIATISPLAPNATTPTPTTAPGN
jgi:hypothetical protein